MIAATFYIMKDISLVEIKTNTLINILVMLLTFVLLQYTKVASPVLVFFTLLLGYLF